MRVLIWFIIFFLPASRVLAKKPRSFSGKVCFSMRLSYSKGRLKAGMSSKGRIRLQLGKFNPSSKFLRKIAKYIPESASADVFESVKLDAQGLKKVMIQGVQKSRVSIKTWKGMLAYKREHIIQVNKVRRRIELINRYRESLALMMKLKILGFTTPRLPVFCAQAVANIRVRKRPGSRAVWQQVKRGVEVEVRGGRRGWAEISYPKANGRRAIGWVKSSKLWLSKFMNRCVQNAKRKIK